ncbi:hypothetical protein CAPTEDRAFT_222075 [Capitella teleta]|uniref:Centrosomal protein of 78 kDa n=1 Tax=Capitella teleta TaxID=283909 RepID=R7T9W0_CAPTE|nr:hypothetical protein CAPTEDRAFT_222075 [Capitella teleta]|eukprot:ELT88150.1 hypothetical protein CAPTEDRAFT_222075 [Capitella teleta]
MAMIESVAVRQQGAFHFETHYDNLCALQASCPLAAVKARLPEGVLDVNGDRIRATDWMPIVNSLRINKTLDLVAIRSFYQNTLDDHEKNGTKMRTKAPSIRSKEITFRICKSLKECLVGTPTLSCIELQGLPLRERDLQALARGIAKNATLKHISLESSSVGNDGLEILCKGVKNSKSLTSLNFSACGLSWKGAETLAKIIKHQAIKRHNEAWQDSLRYRRPDLDRMSGIRRITINCNTMIGDQGALALAEALKDDLWLKALDLQQCGLTDVGSKALLEVLKYNTAIVVMDLRQNPMIDQELLRSIMEQVMINCNGQDTEYKWILAQPLHSEDESMHKSPSPRARSKKRTKTLQNSFGKKTSIKISPSVRRSKSTPSRPSSQAAQNSEPVKPGPGMPWRTAMRANRYRGYPPESESERQYEAWSECSSPASSPKARRANTSSVRIDFSADEDDETETVRVIRGQAPKTDFRDIKEVKVELEQLRRRLKEETQARANAEERIIELTLENSRMRHEVETSQLRQSLLDDDCVLDSIEQSFQQFHAFLDLLRDAGLGQLISLAGIDQSSMPFAKHTPGQDSDNNRSNNNSYANFSSKHDLEASGLAHSLSGLRTSFEDGQMLSGIDLHSDTSHNASLAMFLEAHKSGTLPTSFQNIPDPTMQAPLPSDTAQTSTKFDELYSKVLQETEGVLTNTRVDVSAESLFKKKAPEAKVEVQPAKKSEPSGASIEDLGLDPDALVLEHHDSCSDISEDIEKITDDRS